MKPELSYLAHNLVEIDKYRVETCCVIGECNNFVCQLICVLVCDWLLCVVSADLGAVL